MITHYYIINKYYHFVTQTILLRKKKLSLKKHCIIITGYYIINKYYHKLLLSFYYTNHFIKEKNVIEKFIFKSQYFFIQKFYHVILLKKITSKYFTYHLKITNLFIKSSHSHIILLLLPSYHLLLPFYNTYHIIFIIKLPFIITIMIIRSIMVNFIFISSHYLILQKHYHI